MREGVGFLLLALLVGFTIWGIITASIVDKDLYRLIDLQEQRIIKLEKEVQELRRNGS